MTNDRPTVEVVLGAIAIGVSIVSLPLPGRGADLTAYAAFLADVCRSHGIDEIVVRNDLARPIEELGLPVRRHSDLRSRPLTGPAGPGFQLVQFTSGSTARPKPVVLDDAALGTNVAAVLAALEPWPGEVVAVSWLPLSHDMGLVGMLLASIAAASPPWSRAVQVVLLDPTGFLRRPGIWLETLSHRRASSTAAPNFGYQMAAQRRPAGPLDLSSLHCAVVGGEITRAETLTAFATGYRHQGLDPRALCPAYGLAELGVAATMTPPGEHWRARTVATTALADNHIAAPQAGEPVTTLVASGQPLPGYEIRCDPAGERTGIVSVRGASMGFNGTTNESYADDDGWYTTGDTGFLSDGWLYVCGRVDDYLVAHGRNIYAPAIEAAVADVNGVRAGRVTAVGLPDGDWVIVAEPSDRKPLTKARMEALQRDIQRATVRVTSARPDEVIVASQGALPLTSSGKLQRSKVRALLLQGDLRPASLTAGRPSETDPPA